MRSLFQRAFEAKFRPLESKPIRVAESEIEDDDFEDEDGSDWSGISDEVDEVETIDHDTVRNGEQDVDRYDEKTFMSSRPPDSSKTTSISKSKKSNTSEEDSTEVANLKNDVALQRLLKESHLLDPSSFKGTKSTPEGKARLKALDLRFKDLGARDSTAQQKMPLSHRKGIISKATDREQRRRKDAAENGVILERMKGNAKVEKRRERGVGGPGVGKFKGGTLKLSSRDLKSIEGPKKDSLKGRRGRR